MIRYNIIRRIISSSQNRIFARSKQTTAAEQTTEYEDIDFDEEEHLEREREIEAKRNKSRLFAQHRNMLTEKVPYQRAESWIHETVKYKRMMYGRYGEASNVNPALCWPDKEELEDKLEYERVAYPETIQQMIKRVAEEKKAKADAIRARDDDVAAKFAKLEEWKAALKAKTAKAEAEARAAKERKDRLVEEVRRHFGFKVDPREDRFKEMLAQKEKEDRKKQKEQRRQVREAKIAEKLLTQGQSINKTEAPAE